MSLRLVHPDWLFDGTHYYEGWGVLVDDESGTIADVGPVAQLLAAQANAGSAPQVERLAGRGLLPQAVNAHSHAFQYALRGRAQSRSVAEGRADFWSWRGEMYRLALSLSPDALHEVSLACFREMKAAGYGTVGEFHYLHHDPEGRRYHDPLLLSDLVIGAAREAGLEVCLLWVAYHTGDIEAPALPEQRRFTSASVDEVLRSAAELRDRWQHDAGVSVGLAPHSVRAVPRSWWRPLVEGARAMAMPIHAHVAEQSAEVEACVARWGRRPVELLADEGVLGPDFTAVHATHLTDAEIALLAESGARVCACPTTERDLGDGFLPAARLHRAGVPICIGSDSNLELDPWSEMRLPELHERLREQRRIVLVDEPDEGGRLRWHPVAARWGTQVGAVALGRAPWRLVAGAPAHFVVARAP